MDALSRRKTIRLTVASGNSAMRLDQFLSQAAEGVSRGVARKLIDLGGVHVNGRRVRKCGLIVKADDMIEAYCDGLPLDLFELTGSHIVYRDRHLLVVDKPAGVDSQPTPSRYKGTLYAALNDYLQDPHRKDMKPTIGMVQRLDRDTSGLMTFSIHPAAHRELSRMFREREVVKRYTALAAGRLETSQGEFRSQLARKRSTNTMKSVARGGREAVTRYRLLATEERVSLVEVEIPTGRSHQIRAHFSEAGHPLLGDDRYRGPGNIAGLDFKRQMLHAGRLSFNHPISGEELDFTSGLPSDMQSAVSFFFEDLG